MPAKTYKTCSQERLVFFKTIFFKKYFPPDGEQKVWDRSVSAAVGLFFVSSVLLFPLFFFP